MPRQKEERPAYRPKENRNRKKGRKRGGRRLEVEKREEEMLLRKNITCWTTKEREPHRYETERTRDAREVGEKERAES